MNYHDYIIVGAGPAGLQMGYFLERANRSYVILEAADTPASFFAHFPRKRSLISFNKRFNFFSEPEFNMRHDWNSLVTDDYGHLFRDYSEELYPNADDLCRYMGDFSEKYALRIQYKTRITSVAYDQEARARFVLTDHQGEEWLCDRLLMATGAVGPNIPEIEGIEFAEGYESLSMDPTQYENKRVAILGRGNSAFEIANHLAGHAAYIHIALDGQHLKLAWDSHFVGDLRSVNNTILDMYQLKSLHASINFSITKITKQPDDTFLVDIEMHLPNWETPGTLYAQQVYDCIIRCTGWTYMAPSLFHDDVLPEMDTKSKYPILNSSWESTVPNLFFIGAAMAARDRMAASGFIHGFRYNIQTLFHLLEERYEGTPLPSSKFHVRTFEELQTLAQYLIDRVSTTAALYQLNGFLCDAILLLPDGVTIFHELPKDYILEDEAFINGQELITLSLEYGFHRYESKSSLVHINPPDAQYPHCSAYLHPIFRRYVNGKLMEECHLFESLVIRYDHADFESEGVDESTIAYNIVLNFLNRIFKVTSETLTVQLNGAGTTFVPWPPEKIREEHEFPVCVSPTTGYAAVSGPN